MPEIRQLLSSDPVFRDRIDQILGGKPKPPARFVIRAKANVSPEHSRIPKLEPSPSPDDTFTTSKTQPTLVLPSARGAKLAVPKARRQHTKLLSLPPRVQRNSPEVARLKRTLPPLLEPSEGPTQDSNQLPTLASTRSIYGGESRASSRIPFPYFIKSRNVMKAVKSVSPNRKKETTKRGTAYTLLYQKRLEDMQSRIFARRSDSVEPPAVLSANCSPINSAQWRPDLHLYGYSTKAQVQKSMREWRTRVNSKPDCTSCHK